MLDKAFYFCLRSFPISNDGGTECITIISSNDTQRAGTDENVVQDRTKKSIVKMPALVLLFCHLRAQ